MRHVSVLLCLVLWACACTDNNANNNNGSDNNSTPDTKECLDGEVYNPQTDACDPVFATPDSTDDTPDVPDTPADTRGPDEEEDESDSTIPPGCDDDLDGAWDPSCTMPNGEQGDDCDDEDRNVSPGFLEVCDEVDNDCDGSINEGLQCVFYAHTNNELYRIDPFKKTAQVALAVPEGIKDIDTDPATNKLYGITDEALFVLESDGIINEWVEVGEFQLPRDNTRRVNGLAIGRDASVAGAPTQNTAFATGDNKLYRIDLSTGRAQLVGEMAPDIISSGDCVINKSNTLYMTAKTNGENDTLVRITYGQSDASAERPAQKVPTSNVFGLTAAWGNLYGTTRGGELMIIDPATGAGTVIHTFVDNRNNPIGFFGAASSPTR